MKLTIKWIPAKVKEMKFEDFMSYCRGSYKSYYAKVSDEQIKKEFEFITGKKVKIKKIKNDVNSM